MDYLPWLHDMVNGEGRMENGSGVRKSEKHASDVHVEHCAGCFRSQCSFGQTMTTRNGGTGTARLCPVVICARCDLRMHRCKLEEHVENLCAEAVVPCINAGNGCDMNMKRKVLGKHLEECPASIIFCSVEWNRWPLHYTDKHSPLPFFLPNPHGHPEQLDMALALRDQTCLNVAYSAPRHFKRLRNDLTERFPAVPLPSSRPVPEVILRERRENGEGGGGGMELSRDGSVESEEEWSWSDAPWNKRKNPPGLSRSLCSKLYQASRQTTETLKAALQMITEQDNGMDEEDSLRDLDSVDADDDVAEMGGSVNMVSSPATTMESVLGIAVDPAPIPGEPEGMASVSPVPIPPPLHHPVALGLNLTVETITRYQTKPKSMLTFVCGQTFRRSEYAGHYRNVHSEIQGGLTWIEQRCPLAQYGCPFSLRRIYPSRPDATVIHSAELQSFGIRRTACDAQLRNDTGGDYLSELPPEILTKIVRKLDGYSLNSFSRVNRRLRQLCVGVLEKQGMVQQEWIRAPNKKWKIGFQRWTFSCAFDEVESWAIRAQSTGQHLLHCPFYRRLRHTRPVPLLVSHRGADPAVLQRLEAAAVRCRPAANEELVVPEWSHSCDTLRC
ncbi:F-box only protein 30-like [Paramacrobiotus metropolitanus]|uniref:F-box only protein 30-like n=1 Tax=Paramacrobiotus metropolitanus TaxID=2943436 RepID=UPI002445A8E7|nr:F-box only protein 30-like [Paramacrobiotus metropolitanus]